MEMLRSKGLLPLLQREKKGPVAARHGEMRGGRHFGPEPASHHLPQLRWSPLLSRVAGEDAHVTKQNGRVSPAVSPISRVAYSSVFCFLRAAPRMSPSEAPESEEP